MAIAPKVKKYLDKHGAEYEAIVHKTVYTAFDAAQTMRVKLGEIAKTLVVMADRNYYLVVLPASHRLDEKKLQKALKSKKISITKEKVLVETFKVKEGGLTPFGALHGLETIVDKSLLGTKKVILSAGSFTDSVRLKVKDFVAMEQAQLMNISQTAKFKKPKPQPKKKKAPVKKSVAKKKAPKIAKRKPAASKRKIVKKQPSRKR